MPAPRSTPRTPVLELVEAFLVSAVDNAGTRRSYQHLVPIPEGTDLLAINTQLVARLDAQAAKRRGSDGKTASERGSIPASYAW